jgi:hypothetical protein
MSSCDQNQSNQSIVNNASEFVNNINKQEDIDRKKEKVERLKAGLFFTFVTTVGVLSGFSFSLGTTKKRETEELTNKELRVYHQNHNRGVELARKALLKATLYSVGGFSLFCFSVWKLSGATSFTDFRQKIGSALPRISKEKDKTGRTEFENLTDLFQFIIDEDNKNKKTKKSE